MSYIRACDSRPRSGQGAGWCVVISTRRRALGFPGRAINPDLPTLLSARSWRSGNSNPEPSACKAGALPVELLPQGVVVAVPDHPGAVPFEARSGPAA